jgi:hypothetical protein
MEQFFLTPDLSHALKIKIYGVEVWRDGIPV